MFKKKFKYVEKMKIEKGSYRDPRYKITCNGTIRFWKFVSLWGFLSALESIDCVDWTPATFGKYEVVYTRELGEYYFKVRCYESYSVTGELHFKNWQEMFLVAEELRRFLKKEAEATL